MSADTDLEALPEDSRELAALSSRPATVLRWLGDGVAVLLLGALLWWLARHDGGRNLRALATVGWLALVAVPVAAMEAAGLSRLGRALLAAWGFGLLASFAFAAERGLFVPDVLVFSLVPLAFLMASRLLRRRWGPGVIVVLLLLAVGQYWYDGFLTWWGDTLWGRLPMLRPLSWHNQSGMLMGALGLAFLGLALAARRVLAVAGTLVAGACLAGAWLSGSRGAVVAVGVGALVVVAFAARGRPWRVVTGRLAATVAISGLLVAVLLGMVAPGAGDLGSQPLTNRDQAAGGNLVARFRHMGAAIGMFADRPLTGHGPGSYRHQALEYTPPNANLTSSAHNEYLEVLGEGGLLFGGAFWAVHLVALVLLFRTWRRVARSDDMDPTNLRTPLVAGAAGLLTALGLHAAIDFDWGYLVLPVLLAVGVAILASRDTRSRTSTSRLSGVGAVAPLVALLVVGAGGWMAQSRANTDQSGLSAEEYARSPVGWDHPTARDVAWRLSQDGRHDIALGTIDRAIAWNPGMVSLQIVRDVIAFRAGDLSTEELLAGLGRSKRFDVRNVAAAELIETGRYTAAESLLDELVAGYDEYRVWGIESSRAESWRLLVRLHGLRDGCGAARETMERAVATGLAANDTFIADAGLSSTCTQGASAAKKP